MAKFAAVAISADVLQENAKAAMQASGAGGHLAPPPLRRRRLDGTCTFVPSAGPCLASSTLPSPQLRALQLAKKREARARARRAGGGGILGAMPAPDAAGAAAGSDDEERDPDSGFLDAAQLKVAEALQQRLNQVLEVEEAPAPAAARATAAAAHQQQQHEQQRGGEGEDGGEVRLFRRVKAGARLIDRQRELGQQAGGGSAEADADGAAAAPSRAAAEAYRRHLEEPTKKRCRAAATDAAAIEAAAAAAARQAAPRIASPPNWLPADDDPCRWSHRRRRRAAKLEAEAEAWRQKQAAQGVAS